jgi:hypothetical protein
VIAYGGERHIIDAAQKKPTKKWVGEFGNVA